jgi:hypothetical protein
MVAIEGGPHAIAWTHADQVNRKRRAETGRNCRD